MPATYTLISSNSLSSSAASVTFSAIPTTYTDLVLRWSARGDTAAATVNPYVRFNGITSSVYSRTWFYGTGTGGEGGSRNSNTDRIYVNAIPAATSTSSTFGNAEMYIPSYLATQNKQVGVFTVTEYDAANVSENINGIAGLYSQTTAISEILIAPFSGNFVSGSSFWLYGISKS